MCCRVLHMGNSYKVTPPPRRSMPRIPDQPVVLEPPKQEEIEGRTPPLMKAVAIGLPVVMIVVMGVMMKTRMATMGAAGIMMGMSMLPMVMMMAMQMLQRAGGDSGNSEADLDKDRKLNQLLISENRKKVHATGRAQHKVQTRMFPRPESMITRMEGLDDTFWTINQSTADNLEDDGGEDVVLGDIAVTSDPGELYTMPYLVGRVGVGAIPLNPGIEVKADSGTPLSDTLEPVTNMQTSQFVAAQSVVPKTPVGYDVSGLAYGMRGPNDEARDNLARSLVLSLAFSHNPEGLSIGIVCPPERRSNWEWIKWLPHNANLYAQDGSGFTPLMCWDSLRSAAPHLAAYSNTVEQYESHIFVVVDTPDEDAALPAFLSDNPEYADSLVEDPDTGTVGIQGVTFLVVRSTDDSRMTDVSRRFHIDEQWDLRTYTQPNPVRVDSVPVVLAQRVAAVMSGYIPTGYGPRLLNDSAAASAAAAARPQQAPTMLEALGIQNVEDLDIRNLWERTDRSDSLDTVIGFQVSTSNNRPTGELMHYDIQQLESGGSGPHTLLTGGTGSGKSFLLSAIILLMCARYSPDRLVVIAADFKGGSTFRNLAKLPHFLANITNLGAAADMVARIRDVLLGEAERRQELLDRYDCKDFVEYRRAREKDPSMPPFPALVFVADEFREFIIKNPGYKEMFASIGAVGRSLDMHLLLTSQYIDQTLLGEAMEHFVNSGISLKVGKPQYSTAVLGIPDASTLPAGRVALAKVTSLQDVSHPRFQGFNHALPYVPVETSGAHRKADTVEVIEAEETTDVSDVMPFNLTPVEVVDAEIREREEQADEDVAPVEVGEDAPTHFDALLEYIVEEGSDYATDIHQMWPTPMSTPMTFADIDNSEWDATSEATFRIGDIDIPYEHRRAPMTLSLEGSAQNIQVIGSRGSGRSMALKTMIASSSMTYVGRHIAWMVYDYSGAGMSDMSVWPNVSAAASRNNDDLWARIQGEVTRLLALRSKAMDRFEAGSFTSYLANRDKWGVTGDDYGHVVLAVDGLDDLIKDKKLDDESVVKFFNRVATEGGRLGIHLAFTATTEDFSIKRVYDSAGQRVILHNNDVLVASGDQRLREALKTIPSGDPGRGVDGSMRDAQGMPLWYHSRIMVPIARKIAPIKETDKGLIFDRNGDYSAEIRDLGTRISRYQDVDTHAPKLAAVGNRVSYRDMWSQFTHDTSLPARSRRIPIGIGVGSGVPESLDLSKHLHYMVSGDGGTGATTLLRAALSGISNVYTPEEARVIILDGGAGLFDEFQALKDRGYMSTTSYARNREDAEALYAKMLTLIEAQTPSTAFLNDNPDAMRERSWVEGPELFVIIDKLPRFVSGYSQEGLVRVLQALGSGLDCGVHFIITTPPAELINSLQAPVMKAIYEGPGAQTILMSGNAPGVTFEKARFRSLGVGRARLLSSDGSSNLVQVADPRE